MTHHTTTVCPWDEWTCENAAERGDLSVLQWARANGCPWNAWTCAFAARGGHLDILEWARANGCPWNEETCTFAAWGGHLNILQWARANGCPWDKDTCKFAAKYGHFDVLQWARENGCPFDEPPAHPYDLALWAIKNNDACTLKLVIKSDPNCLDDTHWCTAAEEGHTDMLEVLWRAMIPMDMQDLRDWCEQKDYREAVQWIDNIYN